MSENKIATKADLQRMYNKILPYLGGMPEMVANKFSKGDLYSTEERMIGQWIDGKPLYQKTVEATFGASAVSEFFRATVSHEISNMAQVVDVRYVVLRGTFGTSDYQGYYSAGIVGGNTSGTANVSKGIGCWCNTSKVEVISNDNVVASKNVYITIQYTKTTDSPISIGSDTDYSTEEKIVGTWIDGKPLYQKTLILNETLTTGNKFTTEIGNLSVDFFKLLSAEAYEPAGNRYVSEYYVSDSDHLVYKASNTGIWVKVAGGTYNKLIATIQYTKTTD